MKKGILSKILTVALVMATTVAASVAGTLAYLTDRDSKANVFTVGDVRVELKESFEQGAQLIPGVEIEKKPTIVNTGANEAWVWLEFAIPSALDNYVQGTEAGSNENVIHWNPLGATTQGYVNDERVAKAIADGHLESGMTAADIISEGKTWNVFNSLDEGKNAYKNTIKGVDYNVYVLLYNKALKSGEETLPNIYKVFLDTRVDIDPDGNWHFVENGVVTDLDWNSKTDGAPVIYVGAYAMQKEKFDSVNEAYAAYQKQWGNNGSEFEDLPILDYSIPAAVVENGKVKLNGSAVLSGTYAEPIEVSGNGTLHLRDLTVSSSAGSAIIVNGTDVKLVVENDVTLESVKHAIEVPAGAKLDLSGEFGHLNAVGGNGTDTDHGGHGIGGEGEIYIHDLDELTAEGYGKHAFGIGGNVSVITIENTDIDYARGGYVQPNFVNDTSYGKSEPEGGAAIGSSLDGAVITLKNVTIDFVEGGSKAAAIGGNYWTGVTVNVENCSIKDARGGNASAAIGGSRIEGGATAKDSITVNIKDSTIVAAGGEFAAGIGSGYNTHCEYLPDTVITINITGNSNITATGGKYGAGIGTGYHVSNLAGKIESTVTVNATAGESRNKYTYAMPVGYGVIDITREAQNAVTSFDYQGTTITVNSAEAVQ